jgi:hypothetical protein
LIALLAAIILPGTLEVLGRTVQVIRTPVRYSSCARAAASGDRVGEGRIETNYAWGPATAVDGHYVGTLNGQFLGAFVRIPIFQWPHMTQQERVATDRTESAMVRHELGHVAIGIRIFTTQPLPMTIVANSVAEYDAKARARANMLGKEVVDANARYDEMTQHGITQSRSPIEEYQGTSTALSCPRK